MIRHFYNKGEDVPIWALFEILKLGDFANFVFCLNQDIRARILEELGMRNAAVDTSCSLLSSILYTIRPLRNAVAHNNVIFDARMNGETTEKLSRKWLESETGVLNITFYTIIDFIILVSCLLKKVDANTARANQLVRKYGNLVDALRCGVTPDVFNMIIQSRHDAKIQDIARYLN